MGTIFIAGVYGVGKSTLARELALIKKIPHYSSSALISAINGEQYGRNKSVKDKYRNQDILTACVSQLLEETEQIILTGHFCILGDQNKVEELPQNVFYNLELDSIVLLEASPDRIVCNLHTRDGIQYPLDTIRALSVQERTCAQLVSNVLGCPLVIHHMCYDGSDLEILMSKLF